MQSGACAVSLRFSGRCGLLPSCLRRSGRERRAGLYAPVAVLTGHDVDRLEAAEQRAVAAEAAELDLQVDLVRAAMHRRPLVPLAARPAVAGAGAEVLELVVAALLPNRDLAAGDPHVREVAGGVDRDVIAAIEPGHVGVEHGD